MEMDRTKNIVLDKEAIHRRLRRMALQVAEQNFDEHEIIIAGIAGNGTVVATCLIRELNRISSLKTTALTIPINKKDPGDIIINSSVSVINKVVLLVDDVADTGRTMVYALKPFLNFYPKKIQTLVLVERSHKLFPVQTDYVGLSISTTLQEHIEVITDGEMITGAWLY